MAQQEQEESQEQRSLFSFDFTCKEDNSKSLSAAGPDSKESAAQSTPTPKQPVETEGPPPFGITPSVILGPPTPGMFGPFTLPPHISQDSSIPVPSVLSLPLPPQSKDGVAGSTVAPSLPLELLTADLSQVATPHLPIFVPTVPRPRAFKDPTQMVEMTAGDQTRPIVPVMLVWQHPVVVQHQLKDVLSYLNHEETDFRVDLPFLETWKMDHLSTVFSKLNVPSNFRGLKNLQNLIALSFVHSSVLGEIDSTKPAASVLMKSWEHLSWLGDSVLQLCVSNLLFHTALSPGELTRLRSVFVNNDTCALLSEHLGFWPLVQIGEGVQTNRKMMADVFEAILGALFVVLGFDETRTVVKRLFELISQQ